MTGRNINTLKRAEAILDEEFCKLEDKGLAVEDDYYMDMVGEALAALSEVLDQLRTR